ncbi:uncharacterized protein [Labrus bergylta]|uniref:uncharacterized protein isoform X2 n=1 Tax=Labrus bergylta TaxID=56723 RepID=UPI0033142D08
MYREEKISAVMNSIRKWLNKPKKGVENQLKIRPLTSERKLGASDEDTPVTEMLSCAPTREILKGDRRQEHDVQQPLRTTAHSSLLQVEPVAGDRGQVQMGSTGGCDITSFSPVVGGATKTPGTSVGLRIRPLLKARDACSLPSSPHPAGGARLACSLPGSPLLRGRCWKPSPSSYPSSSSSSSLSRLWVEEALQRSKNLKQSEPCHHLPCSRQEGGRGRSGETEEKAELEGWSDEGEKEDKQVETVSAVGIRLSETVIFRPLTSSQICGGEEDLQSLCLESNMWRYCLLTPCVCLRCPSAPPFEAELFSDVDLQKHGQNLTQPTKETEGDSELSLPRDRAPQQGQSSGLYPSLSPWRITPVCQTDLDRKQEQDIKPFLSCSHGNNTGDHLPKLCEMSERYLCQRKIRSGQSPFTIYGSLEVGCVGESCSFCSFKFKVQNTQNHLCRNCAEVFCGR